MPVTIAWVGSSGQEYCAWVAGEPWLAADLRERLGAAEIIDAEVPQTQPAAVAARGALTELSDEMLASAPLVVLLDPLESERLRALRLLAGRSSARLIEIPALSTAAAAEHTLLLMLSLVRRLLPSYSALVAEAGSPRVASRLTDAEMSAPNWVGMPPLPLMAGKTLGLIGLGRVGEAVARRAVTFGLRVIYDDPVAKPIAELRIGVQRRRFDQLLREADIVSLHLPLTDGTIRLIDAPELALMRSDAYLLNTAHGRLIDEGSLIRALRQRAIAGAGLDVFAYEPLSQDSPLLALDNVVLTPHVAGLPADVVQQDFVERTVRALDRLDGA